MTECNNLDLTPEQMQDLMDQTMSRIKDFIFSLDQQPTLRSEGEREKAIGLIEALPRHGQDFSTILQFLFEQAIPSGINTASAGFMGYIPSGGLFHAAIADVIAAVVNRQIGVSIASPALAQLEANVIRWFGEMIGYPQSARGSFTSGGSLATLTAIATARTARLGDEFAKGTIYFSDQTHYSVPKAAALAGISRKNMREVPSDSRFRIDVPALCKCLRRDRASGYKPFLLVANAGTTNTGAIDDLLALSELAVAENLWLHVDAAYGGFFALTSRGQAKLIGLDRVDSVTLDPHKGLSLPYGTGAVLVRDGEALRRAHSSQAPYMPEHDKCPDLWNFTDISAESSRAFRGLRIWLPMKMHGAGAFEQMLDEKLDLVSWLYQELQRFEEIEIVGAPDLTVIAFRLKHREVEQQNQLNQELLKKINARQRVFLSSTILNGIFTLRLCVLSHRTRQTHVQRAVEDIHAAVRELYDAGFTAPTK